MDKEYIERKALLKDIEESVVFSIRDDKSAEVRGARKVMYRIMAAPSVDVAEAKHGKWIYHECVASHEGTISGYSCSVCSAAVNEDVFDTDEFHKKRCGNCGAKMDGDIKNTDLLHDVGKKEIEIKDFHIGNVSRMCLPWFSADNKGLLEKVLFFHKMDYPSEMDMELIVIIEGSMQPTILFYDGINFYSEEENGDICFYKVTHWMPLPAPPEKGDVV